MRFLVKMALAAGLLIAAPAVAQEQAAWLEQGWAAFEGARYEEAVHALERVDGHEEGYAEARYLLARIYWKTPLRDARRAGREIDRALEAVPGEERFLTLKLALLEADDAVSSALATAERRNALAREILAVDSSNVLANLVLGRMYAADFASSFGAAGFAQATMHLRRTLEADPAQQAAYALLMQVYARRGAYQEAPWMLARMQRHFAREATYLLYRGLTSYKLGALAEADASFREALSVLPAARRHAFEDITRFLSSTETDAYLQDPRAYTRHFWAERDPRFLTPVNERWLEHCARLVYADLLYGDDDVRGWDTEPGEVIVRYGEPLLTTRHSALLEDYLLFHYGDLQFKFMRINRTGAFTFYAPPAKAFSNVRSVHQAWENDFVLKARETFRDVPERFVYSVPGRRVAFPYLVSRMKGDGGKADVYVALGVPLEQDEPTRLKAAPVQTGAFLTAADRTGMVESRGVVGAAEARMPEPGSARLLGLDIRELEAAPGRYSLSVEFAAPAAKAAGFQQALLEVPDYSQETLVLSDLLLAYAIEEGRVPEKPGWVGRHGWAIRPAPWGVYDVIAPVSFYFEAYDLALRTDGSTHYTVEARLTRRDDASGVRKLLDRLFGRGQPKGVSVRFERHGTAADDAQVLHLDVQNQAPGAYVLGVRVTDGVSGREARAWRNIWLE